ncbi:hypothetical protein, partial [Corynebacterium hadale]|uniref:hypothetical protein n=1 Tax=Corynebacterium hadale TaxID=2026255 RepID=UPI00196AAA4C
VIIHVQANKTTTTTHNANAVRRPCAAPDTQQHANIPKTMFAENWSPPAPHKAEASNPAGAHPPGIYTKQIRGSHTLGDINHQPTTVGTTIKAP